MQILTGDQGKWIKPRFHGFNEAIDDSIIADIEEIGLPSRYQSESIHQDGEEVVDYGQMLNSALCNSIYAPVG